MNRNRGIITIMSALAMVMTFLVTGTAMADNNSEVKALVEKGVVMAMVEGKEAVIKAIGDPKGPFIKGDLYLFSGPLDKVTMSAHPYKSELVGTDLSTFRDNHGNFLFFEFVKIALNVGAGCTEYWWPKPGATKASLKKTYVMKVPGKNMYIGGGYYAE